MPSSIAQHPRILGLVAALLLTGCATPVGIRVHNRANLATVPAPDAAQSAFFAKLSTQCGATHEGVASVTPNRPGDHFAGRKLVLHLASCSADEIRIPFAVGDNRSRTIIIRNDSTGLSVKHDHRHADGTPEAVTMYGGPAVNGGSALVQSFTGDPYTTKLIPNMLSPLWIMRLSEDGQTVRYDLEVANKQVYRFDLRKVYPVAMPALVPLPHAEQEAFWSALQRLCGRAYTGRITEGVPADRHTVFAENALVMHVRECTPTEIRIPFHGGENRSRTWVLTRTAAGLRLKHDHRHQDGTEDQLTQYGGDTNASGSANRQEFPADAVTANLRSAWAANVWMVEVVPGERFVYALRREGTDVRFRFEFDLTRQVTAPPAPWGFDAR
jgi:hypothetical protein